jgi:uncharacterized membrane protein
MSGIFFIVWLIGKFTFEPLDQMNDVTVVFSQFVQVGCSVVLLLGLLREDGLIWEHDARFWTASGILFYAVGTLFIFGLFNYILNNSLENLKKVLLVNLFFQVVTYVLFFCAMYVGIHGDVQSASELPVLTKRAEKIPS